MARIVNVLTRTKVPVFSGAVISEWSENGVNFTQVEKSDGGYAIISDKLYVVENDTSKPVIDDPKGLPVQLPVAPVLKSKERLSDEDIERVLSKVGDVSLTALKSIGLKSSELYPLMIRINTALKSAMTHRKAK